MFSIGANGIIQISRGDTCYGNLFINLGTELEPIPYELGKGEALYFGVMEANSLFRDSLICKKITEADKVPGEQAEVYPDYTLEPGDYPVPRRTYYTRKPTNLPVGYLVGVDPDDGETYLYEKVDRLSATQPVQETLYYLSSVGHDYFGYYQLRFESKDTEHVMPGVYYYETKLSRLEDGYDFSESGEPTPATRVDTIVPKTKFIVLD